MIVYTLKTSVCGWCIAPSVAARWVLKRASTGTAIGGWIPVKLFFSPEEAAAAVREGTTGEADWDGSENRLAQGVGLESWTKIDQSAFDGRPEHNTAPYNPGANGANGDQLPSGPH